MIFFITFLKALAAVLITNNHYTGIYPTDALAKGGMVGNILFFAVSGYLLYNVKLPFLRWYGKRLWRIYLPVVLVTGTCMAIGLYQLKPGLVSWHDFLLSVVGYQRLGKGTVTWWYLYPTYYHFVASIVVLYIPYYFCVKIQALRNNLGWLMLAIAVVWICAYFTVFDRSTNRILNTHDPFIRFMFMESMLLGAWFRQNDVNVRNKGSVWFPILAVVCFAAYVVLQGALARYKGLVTLQIVAPFVNLAILYFIFRTCAGYDSKLEKLPVFAKKFVTLLSDTTLEIYLVQFVLIRLFKPMHMFPVNWFLLTFSIIISAYITHIICGFIYSGVDKLTGKGRLSAPQISKRS